MSAAHAESTNCVTVRALDPALLHELQYDTGIARALGHIHALSVVALQLAVRENIIVFLAGRAAHSDRRRQHGV